ncbi:putative MFS nicotinic acid transporter Tna1 [Acaromyces ingoldii]|uniref:Putative MFS nicotinic acid transporter Tna1 n=1 Tax=Acaromyces ingoldii TaxID=215250 RepID=A0A316YD53_9BASI|nr:putative MFS nicotinic acid transporter Tna1 [Acaromyces ingoldii]PWN87159.1 putative MFS nicotinic acid transporter Tna1 [Acaromyces ingoldii]
MTKEEEKRLLRKIDWAIVPYCSLLYLLSFLDRVNIGQAAVAGLKADLGITGGNSYAVALSLFFVGYVVFEVPSNLALKALKPHRWIPFIMISWSIVMVCMGLVRSGAGLIAARFFLGVAEGGLFPGINFMLTCWYSRREQTLRISIFFAGATLAGAFGGILAYGLNKMVATPGGWRWIFIIEGLITFVCALPAWWAIVDFPAEDNKLLNKEEARKWNHKLAISQGVTNANTPFSWAQVREAFLDWKTWMYSLMYISIANPLYSLALFTPTIIQSLDFSGASANLLSVPPYVVGFITTLTVAYLSDRTMMRGPFIIGSMFVVVIGYIILICDVAPGVKYFAIFLTVAGVSPSIGTSIAFVGSNFGPVYRRATTMGIYFTIGNSAGLVSSNVYPMADAPRYIKGHAINLGFAAVAILSCAVLMFHNIRENRRRDAISYAHPDGRDVDPSRLDDEAEKKRWGYEGKTREELLSLGHRHLAFRYVW